MREDRRLEVNSALNLIEIMCLEADIALVPHKTPQGKEVVGVLDNKSGEIFYIQRKGK